MQHVYVIWIGGFMNLIMKKKLLITSSWESPMRE